jgi:2'-5' RNA ligase
MPRTTRTFIAVVVAPDKAEKLGRLQSLIAPEIPNARWVDPKALHITLAFLGDVDDTELNGVCQSVEKAVASFEPFELRVEALGVFPNPDRPRTVWAGLTGPGLEPLKAIQQAVFQAVKDAGYPPPDDRFMPHVTIGRLKPGRDGSPDVGPLLRHYAGWSAGSFPVTEIVTLASNPTPEGPSYTALSRAELAGKNRLGPT